MNPHWTKILDTPRGLRYFRATSAPSRVAVADRSGPTPEWTADGCIWLDTRRPMVVRLGSGYSIPVTVEREGMRKAFVTDEPDGLEAVLKLWKELGGRVSVVGVGKEGLKQLAELAQQE
jgi:hypothetical protein